MLCSGRRTASFARARGSRDHGTANPERPAASAAIVNAIVVPLLFLSGIFIPFGNNTPDWILLDRPDLPGRSTSPTGCRPGSSAYLAFHWTDVLVVRGFWGLAGLALAMRFFR